MQLGMVGLGRMGGNMIRRVMRAGHDGVVFDRNPSSVTTLADEGAVGADSLDDLVAKLTPPRHVWVMVPAGPATDSTVAALGERLQPGDTVIDGGNTYFKDDLRRAAALAEQDIHYVDVGTSGGVWGLTRGYCLMIGGAPEVVARLDPVFEALAPGRGDIDRTPGRDQLAAAGTAEQGYLHCGRNGAGHFVKMVHNGIEYGVMQAYAEGFDLLKGAAGDDAPEAQRYDFAVADIAEVWRRGSVIGSWLLDLTAAELLADPELGGYSGHVGDSGEGRWTVQTAIEQATPVDVLARALFARFRSRQDATYGEKVLSAMRHGFGGHKEKD